MSSGTSPLDPYLGQIAAWASSGLTNVQIVEQLKLLGVQTTKDSVRRAKKRNVEGPVNPDTSRPGITVSGRDVEITGPWVKLSDRKQITPDELKELHGLDPDNYVEKKAVASWWGNPENPSYQLKLWLERKPDFSSLQLDLKPGWVPPPARPSRGKSNEPKLIPIFPDPHAPLNEEIMEEASVAWLEEFQPERVICLGDAWDASPFSRHRKNKRVDLDISVEESQMGTYALLARWRNAAPDADFDLIVGNHDHWLWYRILEKFPELAELTRPGEDHPLLGLRSVLNLDSLRINLVDSGGEYHDNILHLTDELLGLHGVYTGKGGGAVRELQNWEGVDVFQGHDHKTAINVVPKRTANGYVQRIAWSVGTMARRDLGYNHAHDVGQSFGVIVLHPDGRWHPELVLFDPQRGDVTWRSWRYRG